MRILLLVLSLLSSTVHADRISDQRDQLLHTLEVQGSVLTTRPLGTGSVLELHGMYSDTNIDELDVVIAYALDSSDGGALDAAQVAAFAITQSVEASVPKVRGGGMADDGFVALRFGAKTDLTPYLAKVLAAIGAPKVTAAHVDSAKAQLLKTLGTGPLPLDLGIAQLLYTNPPPYAKVSADERRKRISALDLAAIKKVFDQWTRGYVRVTLKGGKPAPDATAKLVRDAIVGWELGAYTAPSARARTSKSAVSRHAATDQRALYFKVELEAANETEAAALVLLLSERGPLRERLFARKHAAFASVRRSAMTVTGSLTILPLRGEPDSVLAAIRSELRTLAQKALSTADLAKLQNHAFEVPGAFEDEKQDPRPIATQHAASAEAIKAIAALTPNQVRAAARKLSATPHAVVILEAK